MDGSIHAGPVVVLRPRRAQQQQQQRRQVSSIDAPLVTTGICGSTSNLVNAIVGSGIIGLPYAMRQSGLVIGLFLLVLVSLATDKSLRLLFELATFHPNLRDLGVLTFEDLMSIPFGVAGRRFILVSMFILAYGAMVSYMIIVKDTLPTVLGWSHSLAQREMVMFAVTVTTMLPLSMMRDISSLACTSALSVIADMILVRVCVCVCVCVRVCVMSHWGIGVASVAVLRNHTPLLLSHFHSLSRGVYRWWSWWCIRRLSNPYRMLEGWDM
jgi:amino acid permease